MITASKAEVLQGTLDLLVLKTIESLGPLHGFGIARRIQQVSNHVLQLNQGTLYPALMRLEQQGWIRSKWGVSDNNRRARFYSLTKAGQRQLAKEKEGWELMASIITRLLAGAEEA
jgi:PadR family transcriptional regulator, regulatory protein PadR